MHRTRTAQGIIVRGFAAMAFLAAGIAAFPQSSHAANRAPIISGSPPASVTSGQLYSFRPKARDPEGKSLTFSIVNRPRWASFNKSTGRLYGTPSAAAAGEYVDIRIRVSDGRLTTALPRFSITVRQANRAPKISGTPPTSAREGQAYSFKPNATDADGDSLRFTIANRPAWATFSAATGVLKGTPGTGTVGTYSNIVIRVSDGRKTVSLPAFAIGVQQASMGSATLSWQPPSQSTSGASLSSALAGYRIHYGTSPGSYPNTVQIANPGVTSYMITNLPPGTYYFVATAYDTAGRESDYSGVVSKKIG